MKKYALKFGEQEFPVSLPEENIAAVLESNKVELPCRSPEEHVREALRNPIGSESLERIVSPGQSVCVVIPDITRLWQSPAVYLTALVEELNLCGIRDEDILLLCATGTHRSQSREEHIQLVSEALHRRVRIADHVCTDTANLKLVGTTSRGTPVWLNAQAMACDKLILTGGVVYHFLAGYGGGPKYVLPGIAGYETIMRHHNLALNEGFGAGSNPEVRSANITSNPFQTDLLEAASLANPCFLLNVVVDDNYKIIQAFAGNYIQAHRAACALVDSIDGVPVQEKTPLVLASAGGYPKDISLYQTIKTLSNALAVVEKGGTMILLSRCGEQFGSAECERQICELADMEEREKELRSEFSIGAYVGFQFCESAERHHLILVTDIPAGRFAKTSIHAVRTLDEALALAARLNGGLEHMKTTLLPHGATTFPKFQA